MASGPSDSSGSFSLARSRATCISTARVSSPAVPMPQTGQQFIAGDGPLAVDDQVAERRRFGFRKLGPRSPADQRIFAALQVDLAAAELRALARFRRLRRPPQHRFDAGQQFAGRERLDHVIVRPHLQAAHAVVFPAAGRQDDDRPCRADSAEFGEHFQAVLLRQQQIEQHADRRRRSLPPASPVSPSAASVTSYPDSRRASTTPRRMAGSSSTTTIRT